MMGYKSNFIPTYLKYKYIFFFVSISARIRILNLFSAEPDLDPDPWKKIPDPHPWLYLLNYFLGGRKKRVCIMMKSFFCI